MQHKFNIILVKGYSAVYTTCLLAESVA